MDFGSSAPRKKGSGPNLGVRFAVLCFQAFPQNETRYLVAFMSLVSRFTKRCQRQLHLTQGIATPLDDLCATLILSDDRKGGGEETKERFDESKMWGLGGRRK